MQHAAVLAVIMHGLVCVLSEPPCNRFEEVDEDEDDENAAGDAEIEVDVEVEAKAG
jgi:hypothetical protein